MALSWSDVKRWNPSSLEHASYDVRGARSVLEGACDDLEGSQRRLISQGEAPDAIRKKSRQLSESTSNLVADTSELMMACAEACDGVWQVQTKVMDCEQLAQASGVHLDPATGHVEDNTQELLHKLHSAVHPDPALIHQINARRRAAEDLRQMVADVLALAEQVDADFARRLASVERGVGMSSHASASAREGAGAHSQGLADLPDASWSSTEVSLWWSSMSDAEKQWLVDHHPEAIGNLDGVEFSWRDKANRARIDRELETAQKEYDAIQAEYLDKLEKNGYDRVLNLDYADRMKLARERLADLQAIKAQFTPPGTQGYNPDSTAWRSDPYRKACVPLPIQDLQLLTLDTSGGRIRAAVGIGNIDKADHVGVFVPGMGTRVNSSLRGYIEDVDRLQNSSLRALEQQGRRGSVATVAWLGYDAPAALGHSGWTKVASTGLAHAGAERLTSFSEGIESMRSAAGSKDAHLTVVGHSYGSTTSGIAVNRVKSGVVDDLVMFGSPGSGVQDSRLYNLDSGKAYVSGVEHGDAVQGIGIDKYFGKDPMRMDGVEHLSNQSDAEGNGSWPFKRHGTDVYLDDDSEILEDMGRVIGGVKR